MTLRDSLRVRPGFPAAVALLFALGSAGGACSKKAPEAVAPPPPPQAAAPQAPAAQAQAENAPVPEAAPVPKGSAKPPKDFAQHLEEVARKAFRVPPDPSIKFALGTIKPSETAGLYEVEILFTKGDQKFDQTVYVSSDWKSLFPARLDVFVDYSKAFEKMNLKGRPTMGPANAPVTIVEYSDFQ